VRRAPTPAVGLTIAPNSDGLPTASDSGWLVVRIAAGILAIAVAAWLAARFRRRITSRSRDPL
jgi:hypothetical protein